MKVILYTETYIDMKSYKKLKFRWDTLIFPL